MSIELPPAPPSSDTDPSKTVLSFLNAQTVGDDAAKMRKWRSNYKEVQKRKEKNIELTHSFVPDLVLEHEMRQIVRQANITAGEQAAKVDESKLTRKQIRERANETKIHENAKVEFRASFNHMHCAVVFADVSGFSSLAEHLHHGGESAETQHFLKRTRKDLGKTTEVAHKGAEKMHKILNEFFGEMMSKLTNLGGDVVKLAGDACVAVWRADDENGLGVAAHAATHAILTVVQELNSFESDGYKLSLHAGVGVGLVTNWFVGNNYRKYHVATGLPLDQSTEACDEATSGQVYCSREVWDHLLIQNSGNLLFLVGEERGNLVLVSRLPGRPPPKFKWMEEALGSDLGQKEAALVPYTPLPVRNHINDFSRADIALLRRVTVLFVLLEVSHTDFEEEETCLKALQECIGIMQDTIDVQEGLIKEYGVDDKGTVLVAGFGIPPFGHRDDPFRAVTAAITIEGELLKKGYKSYVGVTTGEAFCGTIGNDVRREFGMIGAIVNLSARLMVANKKMEMTGPNILCDKSTRDACASRIKFIALPAIRVKGKTQPVDIFRPLEPIVKGLEEDAEAIRVATKFQKTPPVQGRENEIMFLQACVSALMQGETPGRMLVEGAAGVGKSKIIFELRRMALNLNVKVLRFKCRPHHRKITFSAWGELIGRQTGIINMKSDRMKRNALVNYIGKLMGGKVNVGVALLGPLASPGFVHIDANVEAMSEEERVAARKELIFKILQSTFGADAATDTEKSIIIIEDAHNMDAESWKMLIELGTKLIHTLVVAVCRTLMDGQIGAQEFWDAVYAKDMWVMRLAGIGLDLMSSVVVDNLKAEGLVTATHCHKSVCSFIFERTQGNPLYVQEWSKTLWQNGMMTVDSDGILNFSGGADYGENPRCPFGVQADLIGSIDSMPSSQQMTLRVCSVLGTGFTLEDVCAVYPEWYSGENGNPEAFEQQVQRDLDALSKCGILQKYGDIANKFGFQLSKGGASFVSPIKTLQRFAGSNRYAMKTLRDWTSGASRPVSKQGSREGSRTGSRLGSRRGSLDSEDGDEKSRNNETEGQGNESGDDAGEVGEGEAEGEEAEEGDEGASKNTKENPELEFGWLLQQDVIYNSIPFAERQSMHEKIATLYKALAEYDSTPHIPEIAHHSSLCGDEKTAKALTEVYSTEVGAYMTQTLLSAFGKIEEDDPQWVAVHIKLVPWIRGLHVFNKFWSTNGAIVMMKNPASVDACARWSKTLEEKKKINKRQSAEEFNLFPIEETDEAENTLDDAKDKIFSLLSDEHKDQLASLLPTTAEKPKESRRAPEEDSFIHRLLMGLPPLDTKKTPVDDYVSSSLDATGGSSSQKRKNFTPIAPKSTLMRPGVVLPEQHRESEGSSLPPVVVSTPRSNSKHSAHQMFSPQSIPTPEGKGDTSHSKHLSYVDGISRARTGSVTSIGSDGFHNDPPSRHLPVLRDTQRTWERLTSYAHLSTLCSFETAPKNPNELKQKVRDVIRTDRQRVQHLHDTAAVKQQKLRQSNSSVPLPALNTGAVSSKPRMLGPTREAFNLFIKRRKQREQEDLLRELAEQQMKERDEMDSQF